MKAVRRHSGFTLIELLVVISILAILVGLAVPALKNMGKSNGAVSAGRQMLDDVGRAHQLAISHHTTVYMVFVPTNYWGNNIMSTFPSGNISEFLALTNLADKQLTGYTFVSYGALGDQPGNHQWQYLEPWQNLPQNSFIASWKFLPQTYTTVVGITNQQFLVHGFQSAAIPFPTASNAVVSLPFIAFNYLGQLTIDGVNPSFTDEYIPLAQGTVAYGIDAATKTPLLNVVPASAISETPAGNSTNSMFNLVHIDALTGRSRLEFQQLQ